MLVAGPLGCRPAREDPAAAGRAPATGLPPETGKLGKLEAPDHLEQELAGRNLLTLPLEFRHTSELPRLPLHHGDPFDRILIAQARVERLPLMTIDRKITAYDLPYIPA